MMKLPRSSPIRYATATVAVVLATGIRHSLLPVLGDRQPFVFFYLSVLFAVWRLGPGPSILVVVLSIASAAHFFLPAFNPTDVARLADSLATVNFLVVCSAIIAFGESVRKARLGLEAEVAKLARAERQVVEQARMAEYGRDLGSTLARSTDLVDMLRGCARATVRHLDAAFARIWTLDEAGEVLELRASEGLYTHTDGPHGRIPVGMYKIGKIAQDRRPHLTNSVIGDPLVPEQEWAAREGMVAFAGHPLVVEGRLVGVLAIFARHALSDEALAMIGSVVDEIAVGIERKRAEERLHRQREWLRVTLASIGDGVIATDIEGRVSFLNAVAEGLTGWDQAGAAGRPLEEIFRIVNEETRRTVENPAARAIREGAIVGLANHTVLIARDGIERAIEDSASPIRDERGEIVGAVLVFRDATEARAEQEARERGEVRFRALVAASSQVVWTTDPDGSTVADSPTWRQFTGQTLDQWRGLGWLDAIHPDDRQVTFRAWSEAVGSRSMYRVEYRLRRADGVYRWMEARGVPVAEADGSVREWVGMNTDVHDRKEAEDALRESHRRVADILGSMTDACSGFDGDWRYIYVNRRWEAMFSRKAQDVVGRTLWEVFPEVAGTSIEANYLRAASEGVGASFEVFSPHTRGWLHVRAYPTGGGIASYIQDIDDRKRAEAALRLSEDRLRMAIESAGVGTFDVDPATGAMTWDDRCKAMFGLPPEADVEYPATFVAGLHPDDRERVAAVIAACMDPGGSGEYDVEYRTVGIRDSVERWVAARGRVYFDSLRRPTRFIGTTLNITDRRRASEELRAAKEEAERANEAKSQFLAVLSHELRTPLNPILLAASSMLDRPTDPAELRPTLEMIRQNVNLQARLIDDLLDVMRIVRGKMPLHWEVADCHRLIHQTIQFCRSEVFGKEIRMDLELSAPLHLVNADPARLQQVFWNLIKNAVKFTPSGGAVAVRTSNQGSPDDPDGSRVVVEVADTGIGIDPDFLPRIFDPFQQGETTITRRFGGLGLGLAICKGIVEAHGGTLGVESPGIDRGTTFRLALAALTTTGLDAEAESPARLENTDRPLPSSLSILVVEDEPATLRLMARLLRGLGHDITTASTISKGFHEFRAGAFDLIISDIGLPDGSGLELIRRIVAARGPIPAIALTGYGMEEDIRRSREAGFTAHLTKPIDFTKLEAMIQQVAPVRP